MKRRYDGRAYNVLECLEMWNWESGEVENADSEMQRLTWKPVMFGKIVRRFITCLQLCSPFEWVNSQLVVADYLRLNYQCLAVVLFCLPLTSPE